MSLRPRRLSVRLYLAFLGVLVAVALGSAVLTWLAGRSAIRVTRFHGPEVVYHLSRELPFNDAAQLREALERMHRDLDLDIAVFDTRGRLVGSSGTEISPPGPATFMLLQFRATWLKEPFVVGGPIHGLTGPRGVMLLRLRSLEEGQRLLWRTLAVLLGGLAVSLALVYPLSRSITRPLERLTSAAEAFGRGNLSARSGIEQDDEVGRVARAFDQMAERIAAARRAERELLANVSHELRTPLARVRVALGLIENPPDATKRRLAVVEDELDELERLISNVLAATKLDLAALPIRRTRVSVRELAERGRDRILALEPEREVEIQVPDRLEMDLDRALISRALDNLLDNARKYDESGKPMRIEISEEGSEVMIAVVDHGIGIPPDELDRVFDPFFRGANARGRSGGFGLGLALARRITQAHGGTARAMNTPQGGARFELRLPREPPPPALSREPLLGEALYSSE
jgi:two-component system, OmpR family, sensor kinase